MAAIREGAIAVSVKRYTSLALLLCFAATASGAAPAPTVTSATPDFFATLGSPKSGGDDLITVELNKGKPLHLAQAAASVAIANPNIADVQVVSPHLLFINGKGVGETSLIAVDAQDNIIAEGNIVVTHNLSRFERAADDMLPGQHITSSSTDNAIILKGKVDSPVEAEKLQRLATSFLPDDKQKIISMLDTSGSDQVMLKVKIVELSRTELKRFGINWESVLNSGSFIFGYAQGRDIISGSSFTRDAAGDFSLGAGYTHGGTTINSMIDALEQDGLVSVLAEPNLTTRSGQTASFLAGGEVPIPVVQASAGSAPVVTIQYQQFGVSLQFTPVVMSKDKISLTVLPEVSALSDVHQVNQNGFTVPSITTRRASTTVDLGTGQTFAIAGLLRDDQTNTNNKLPGLGDIPVLGTLFRNNDYENDQTELVILVTPYIVRPVDRPEKMLTPMDGYKPPSDMERIFLGKLHGESDRLPDSIKKTDPTPSPTGGLGGQSGFLMR